MAFLGKGRKQDLQNLANELEVAITPDMKMGEIKDAILSSEGYDEEFVKNVFDTILSQRKIEEDTKLKEKQLEEEVKLKQIELQLKMEEETKLKEKELHLKFELEKFKIENANKAGAPIAEPSQRAEKKSILDLQRLLPKFNPEEIDISLFLAMFERQAKNADIDEGEWASHVLALLPLEIGQIILRESEENAKEYNFVKKLLLNRYKLTAECFRQKFTTHYRKQSSRWMDFAYELQNYLEGWLDGLEIKDFKSLKNLMIADQIKRRVSGDIREHLLDEWAEIVSPFQLAEKLDHYESMRRYSSKKTPHPVKVSRERKQDEPFSKSHTKENHEKRGEKIPTSSKEGESEKNRVFEKRRQLRCFLCESPNHLRYNCPQRQNKEETVNEIRQTVEECLKPYTMEAFVNGHKMTILRDTGASFDLICQRYVPPDHFTGESVWLKGALDMSARCLPVAKVDLSGDFGQITTKAGVVANELDQGRYLLGNRTAQLIENFKSKTQDQELVNVVTRSKARAKENSPSDLGKKETGVEKKTEVLPAFESREEAELESEDSSVAPESLENTDSSLIKCSSEELSKEQRGCENLRPIFEKVEKGEEKLYIIKNNLLMRCHKDHCGEPRELIVLPQKFRDRLMKFCHEGVSSHLGVTKTKDRIVRNFFWPNCYKEIEHYVRSCDPCQRAGKAGEKKKAPLKIVPIIREVFSKINIDACGPLPPSETGKRYLITAICMASKYIEAVPVTDISSISVTDALLQIFSRMGFPREIQCDQGTSFTSNLTSEFFERFGIKVRHSSVAHPQSNPVERFHRTLKRLLRVLCIEAESDWERHLPAALLALRTVTHESIGFSPAELVFGKNLRTPEVLLYEHWVDPPEEESAVTEHVFRLINRLKRSQDLAVEKLGDLQIKRKAWYDRNAVKREFNVGDQVLVLATSRPNKLAVHWVGPGTIEAKVSETNYVVKLNEGRERSHLYHVNMLKPYHKRAEYINLLNWEEEIGSHDIDIPSWENEPTIYDFQEIICSSDLKRTLNDSQITQLRQVLNQFSGCFSNDPGLTHLVEHDIKLKKNEPIRSRPYRVSQRQTEILKSEIQRMLKLGIIEIGESDYTSPMVLVEVPGKDPRPCVDYRRLNEIVRTEYFPLPNIEERVEQVAAAKFITLLDLAKGYWQIPLSKSAQRYAAFCTPFGTFRPLRMSFGLKNVPASFLPLSD